MDNTLENKQEVTIDNRPKNMSKIARMFENMISHSRLDGLDERMSVLFADDKISSEEYTFLKIMLNDRKSMLRVENNIEPEVS